MAHKARERKDWYRPSPETYSDEVRRAGIIRLLAEAYCARLRKQGKLKEPKQPVSDALPVNNAYDFLR